MTGELANDILKQLTAVEELVDDLRNGRSIYPEQVETSWKNLNKAQMDASQILDRYEEEEGPIDV